MNRSEMIQLVARRAAVPFATTRLVVDSFLEVVATCLATDEEVNLRGFGRFEPRQRREVRRANPKTQEPVIVPACRAVAFIPSPVLKARINED